MLHKHATNNADFFPLSDQDSVRLLAVEGCAALGKLLEPQDCAAQILPVIVNFAQVGSVLRHKETFLLLKTDNYH